MVLWIEWRNYWVLAHEKKSFQMSIGHSESTWTICWLERGTNTKCLLLSWKFVKLLLKKVGNISWSFDINRCCCFQIVRKIFMKYIFHKIYFAEFQNVNFFFSKVLNKRYFDYEKKVWRLMNNNPNNINKTNNYLAPQITAPPPKKKLPWFMVLEIRVLTWVCFIIFILYC